MSANRGAGSVSGRRRHAAARSTSAWRSASRSPTSPACATARATRKRRTAAMIIQLELDLLLAEHRGPIRLHTGSLAAAADGAPRWRALDRQARAQLRPRPRASASAGALCTPRPCCHVVAPSRGWARAPQAGRLRGNRLPTATVVGRYLPNRSISVSVAMRAPGVAGRSRACCAAPPADRVGASATGEDRRVPRNAGRAAAAPP